MSSRSRQGRDANRRNTRWREGRATIGDLITLVLSGSALLVASVAYARSRSPVAPKQAETRDITDWKAVSTTGHRLGPANARVVVVVFEDYQCPFCRVMHGALKRLRDNNQDVAVISRQLPLTAIHPHAMSAAVAAECAADQGHFETFQDSVFAAQEQIGSTTWAQFAQRSGVGDMSKFMQCIAHDGVARRRITRDNNVAVDLGLSGTPSIIVAGKLLTTPSESLLVRLVNPPRQ